MPDRFAVDDYTLPYGSVGGAGARSMQAELMRRIQAQEAQRAHDEQMAREAEARQRQALMDADALKTSELNRRVASENLALTTETRASQKSEREEKVLASKQKRFMSTLQPGKVTEAQKAEGESLGLGHLFIAKPVMGPEQEVTTETATAYPEDFVGPAAPPVQSTMKVPGQPTGANEYVYQGTPEQQQEASKMQLMQRLMNGELDHLFKDRPQDLEAAKLILQAMGPSEQGLASALATLFKPPKTGAETSAQLDADVRRILMKPKDQWTAEDAAAVESYREMKRLAGEEAARRQVISIEAGFGRQENTFGQQKLTNLITNVENDQKVYQNQAEAALKGINLLNSGGTSDMAAVSQFLTATSGGFGSGQRINDTELNAVLDSRSLWDDWYIRMQRLRADGKPVDKLSPTQRQQMKDMLMIALKDADTAIDQNIATVADAGDAALASHWRKTQDRMRQKAGLSKPGAAPAAATPQMPAVRNVTITPAKPKG